MCYHGSNNQFTKTKFTNNNEHWNASWIQLQRFFPFLKQVLKTIKKQGRFETPKVIKRYMWNDMQVIHMGWMCHKL
jgi:hypothetical protein